MSDNLRELAPHKEVYAAIDELMMLFQKYKEQDLELANLKQAVSDFIKKANETESAIGNVSLAELLADLPEYQKLAECCDE